MTKICTKCNKDKPLTDFGKRLTVKSGRQSACKACYNTARRLNHDPVKCKDELLKARFGINLIQYNQLLSKQNDCCAICTKHKSEFNKALAVDHIKGTTTIRGLLCDRCNRAIGLLKDNANTAINAAVYLQSASPDILTLNPEARLKRFMRVI